MEKIMNEDVAGGLEETGSFPGDGYDDDRIYLEKNHLLIGCTGGVATTLLPTLLEELSELKYNIEVQVVITNNAGHFLDKSCFPVRIYCDADEWELWNSRSDPVLHIELRRWADLMVIAPLDANTLAKIANGICDNLLSCVVRAWDIEKPLLFAPSMNKLMWQHPITSSQILTLKSFGYEEIPCQDKAQLSSGEKGSGAMAKVSTVVHRIVKNLERINRIRSTDCMGDQSMATSVGL